MTDAYIEIEISWFVRVGPTSSVAAHPRMPVKPMPIATLLSWFGLAFSFVLIAAICVGV
jgi:hypothetical protein